MPSHFAKEANRFEMYWVNLEPTIGSEIKKIRPCVIISPNALNSLHKTHRTHHF